MRGVVIQELFGVLSLCNSSLRPTAFGCALSLHTYRKLATRSLMVLALSSLCLVMAAGCASLDARPDMRRSVEFVEQATGINAEALLHDSEVAKSKTVELLSEGLSPNEAVQVALLNNPRARAATLEVGVSRADFVQSTLFSNPTLALSFRFPDGGGLANFETALTQNIAELWLIPARKEVAQRQLDRTVLQAAQTIAGIAFDARRAYARAVTASQQEAVMRDTLGISERLLETAELRRQAGTGNEIDVNLARTKKLEVDTNLRNARLATLEAHSELARVLGITESPDTLALEASLPEPGGWALSPESLQELAIENRLDLKIIEQSVAHAEARLREERARVFQSVDLGLAFERAERRSGDETNTITGPAFGIELPIWDQNQSQIAKAERLLEQTRQFRDALLVDTAQDIYSRLARAKTAAENAIFYRDEQLPAAERNVTLSREAYKAGRLSFLNVLEAERSYLDARSGYIDALESAAIATVELEQVTGRPAPYLLSQSEQPEIEIGSNDSTSEIEP